jgi:hypothetical protein
VFATLTHKAHNLFLNKKVISNFDKKGELSSLVADLNVWLLVIPVNLKVELRTPSNLTSNIDVTVLMHRLREEKMLNTVLAYVFAAYYWKQFLASNG